jgi:hypothetical protein
MIIGRLQAHASTVVGHCPTAPALFCGRLNHAGLGGSPVDPVIPPGEDINSPPHCLNAGGASQDQNIYEGVLTRHGSIC